MDLNEWSLSDEDVGTCLLHLLLCLWLKCRREDLISDNGLPIMTSCYCTLEKWCYSQASTDQLTL